MKNKEIFKVGDKVFDIRYGWGKIININCDITYALCVDFNPRHVYYTIDGCSCEYDIIPTLSLTEYTLEGFSQERPINYKDYIGKWGKFCDMYDEECTIGRLYSCDIGDTNIFKPRYSSDWYSKFKPLTEEQLKILQLEQ